MHFINDTNTWDELGSFTLNCGGGAVTKATTNGCGQLLYLVHHQLVDTNWNNSLYSATGMWLLKLIASNNLNSVSNSTTIIFPTVNNDYQVSEHMLLLSNCPVLKFIDVKNGIWVVPEQSVTTPNNLIMYHENSDRNVKVNHSHHHPLLFNSNICNRLMFFVVLKQLQFVMN